MNKKLEENRNKIIELSSENTDDVNMIIYVFAINKKLDSLLIKLDDLNVPTNVSSIVKKGYLTSVEHFYQVLYHFISYINTNLWFVSKTKNYIVDKIIHNKEAEASLYHKEYFHDNNTIPYYKHHFNKAIISNFYRFLNTIPMEKEIYLFLKKHGVDISKTDINKDKDIEKLLYVLKLICIANNSSFGLFYIFDDDLNLKGIQHVVGNFEILIEHAKEYEDVYKTILDNY
ncbi:MAG: hypothetical protein IJ565_06170 [Bacilli bacterium]|nr:hypothetical protein [Bacilli bacterium]